MVIWYVNFMPFKIIYGTYILNLILIIMVLYFYSYNIIKTDGETRIFVLFLGTMVSKRTRKAKIKAVASSSITISIPIYYTPPINISSISLTST